MSSEFETREGEDARATGKGKMEFILGAVLEQALSLLSGKKSRAAEGLDRVSRAIRQTASNLGGEEGAGFSRYAEQAAEQIATASQYLREQDLQALLRDVERLVRRRPAAAAGGALALGFVLARFLKTSSGKGRQTVSHGR